MPALLERRRTCRHTSQSPLSDAPRLLLIDDDPDIHTGIELKLRPFNVQVEHAFYGSQGIAAIAKATPDIILTDLAMPRGDGSYLMEYLQATPETSQIPVIVLTGMRDPNLRTRMLAAGVAAYLNKPAPFLDLLNEMGRFINLSPRRKKGGRHDRS